MASEPAATAVATAAEVPSVEKKDSLTYEIPAELQASLPAPAVERLKAVLELQKEHDAEHAKMMAEYIALELKYEVIFQALFKRRSEVLEASDPAPKGIPGFWLQVLKNSAVAEVVEAHDEPVLQHLEDLTYELLPNNEGYRLLFRFSENDYFTNTELVKTVLVDDMFGDEEITSTKGTKIDWKPNKNVTVQLKSKPAPRRGRGRGGRGGRGGPSKPVEVPVPSFFRFFESTPDLNNLETEDLEEEDFMMLAEQAETDGHLANAIREQVIARAAVLYTGEEAEEDEEEGFAIGGDDDDDDDDDDEDIPVARKPRKKNRKPKATVEEVDDDDSGDGKAPALSFPSFGAAPAFNFNFGSGTGTTLGAPAGGAKQFNFTPKNDNKSA